MRAVRSIALATLVGALTLPSIAAAQRELRETPQRFALGLRFGPYYPAVDDGLGGAPFQDYFGDGHRLLVGLEIDVDAVVIPWVGRAGVGVGIGYTHFGGKARFQGTTTASPESVSFSVVPLYASAFLRVDVLARKLSIPFVFNARLGIDEDLWFVGGPVHDHSGSTLGWRWGLAVWLELDAFERRAANRLDETYGINHSYVTFEVCGVSADGFGSSTAMNLSDTTWALGLAFAI